MYPKIEAITRRIVRSLAPEQPAPVVPRVNELFQFADGMPVEIAIAERAHRLTEHVENARYKRRLHAQSFSVALPDLVADLALDPSVCALSHQQGSNTYKTYLSFEPSTVHHAVRQILVLPPFTVATQKEYAGVAKGIMVATQLRPTPDSAVEQTIVAQWTQPRVVENSGIIYTGFHLQVRDHFNVGDDIYIWQCSVDPDTKTTLLTVPSPLQQYVDYRPYLLRAVFDFEGNYITTVGNGRDLILY